MKSLRSVSVVAVLILNACSNSPSVGSNNLDEARAKNTILQFLARRTDLKSPSILSTGPLIIDGSRRNMTFTWSAMIPMLNSQVNQYKGDASFQLAQDGKWYLTAIAESPNSATQSPNLEVK
jgi:hypothetical protein